MAFGTMHSSSSIEMIPRGWNENNYFCLEFFFYYLLDELDASLQIETEVNECPSDTLTLVLFLFEDEHVVIEELLQTLVDEVNPQLLERVQVENLESGNIEHTDEEATLNGLGVEGLVATRISSLHFLNYFFKSPLNEPFEHAGVDGLGQTGDSPADLLQVLTLVDPLGTDTDTRLGQSLK